MRVGELARQWARSLPAWSMDPVGRLTRARSRAFSVRSVAAASPLTVRSVAARSDLSRSVSVVAFACSLHEQLSRHGAQKAIGAGAMGCWGGLPFDLRVGGLNRQHGGLLQII